MVPSPGSISAHSLIVATRNQVSSDNADEKVILLLDSGMYYSLDPVGASIWSLIQEPRPLSDLRDALLQRYEVSREECEQALQSFLHEMSAEKLIEVREVAAP